MASPPDERPGAWQQRRAIRVGGWLWLGAGLLAVSSWGAERLAAGLVQRWRSPLELSVGQVLGHPLRLGDYRGLSPDGLRLGPSSIGPGPFEGSTARASAVVVGLDPLASLRRQRLVLGISLRDAEVDVRPNARGQWWVLGRPRGARQPPRLDLKFSLASPARLRLRLAGRPPAPELGLLGDLLLQPDRRRLELHGRLSHDRPSQQPGGAAAIALIGNWLEQRWNVVVQPRGLALEAVSPWLPWPLPPRWHLSGRAQGRLAFERRRGEGVQCQGQLELSAVRLQPPTPTPPLQLARLPLRCRAGELHSAGARWLWGDWNGTLQGGMLPGRSWDLQAQAAGRAEGSRLKLEWQGPWHTPFIRLLGQLPLPSANGRLLQLNGEGQLRLFPGLDLRSLRLRSNGSRASLSGPLLPLPRLRAEAALKPNALPLPAPLAQLLVSRSSALQVQALLRGSWGDPRLSLHLPPQPQPLLGHWQADLAWARGQWRLERLLAPQLQVSGRLPHGPAGAASAAPAQLDLALQSFPLERLSPLLATRLHGNLSAWGQLEGVRLDQLRPNLHLILRRPGAGPLRLAEVWAGHLRGVGARDLELALASQDAALPGHLKARLDQRWQPRSAQLERASGRLRLEGRPRRYRWSVVDLPLQGLELALGPRQRFQPLQGRLSGNGELGFQPFASSGKLNVDSPVLLGVRGRRLELAGSLDAHRYRLRGHLDPADSGSVAMQADGRWRGERWSRFEARGLSAAWLDQLVAAWPLWRGQPLPPPGRAADLGSLVLSTTALPLQQRLDLLDQTRQDLASQRLARASDDRPLRPAELGARIDADLSLREDPGRPTWIDLAARGHLWQADQGVDRPLGGEPFVARLRGPVTSGSGEFSLEHLPLELLALITPLPAGLRGGAGIRGRYGLTAGGTSLEAQLNLEQAQLDGRPLELEKGSLELERGLWSIDAALRAGGAQQSVSVSGRVPQDPELDQLDLRIASQGDGLAFLTALAGPALDWRSGDAELQLLVRGSLRDPVASGFLRCRQAAFNFIGQPVEALDATAQFDFDRLRVQEFSARVGEKGRLSLDGSIALVRPGDQRLNLSLEEIPLRFPRLEAQGDGQLQLGGSLRDPVLSGDLRLSRGRINAQPGQLAAERQGGSLKPLPENGLVEKSWDFRSPLVLLGPNVESPTAASLRQNIPRASFLQLDGLRLELGPDLRVVVPNLASFNTGGLLRLQGRLDPSLQASGVVRLLGGRLTLFTTSFSLDPDAPNVAVFTPSLGLVPYVDVALRSRVSDSVNLPSSDRSQFSAWDLNAGFSALDQLRLVKVRLEASGPADRLAESIRLSSSPPLSQQRLLALIGGNSLAGLGSGKAELALATVLGQSLLNPIAGSLSEAFGQRLSFALYPTYVAPLVSNATSNSTRRLPSTLVLGSEIGLDLSERFNASVLAAPNRSDIPPQLILRYQLSDPIGLQGSIDQLGRVQTQLQLFLRF